MADEFFDEAMEQSQVKAAIVSKYFGAWARVIVHSVKKRHGVNGRVAYIDLFAGPGRYKDGTDSTPLKILSQAVANEDLRQMLVTVFNDRDDDNVQSLKRYIAAIPGVETLRHEPLVYHDEVGDNIAREFARFHQVPTLFFIDPFGYRGLSLRLINAVLKDWACECIFFFNYNRINMGLTNPKVRPHMEALFGKRRVDQLQEELPGMGPEEREAHVLETLVDALKGLGGQYVLPFRFRYAQKDATSHHLVFVSKHPLGYEIMKDVMASASSERHQGVATFEYCPTPRRQGLLFELNRPLDELEGRLLEYYAGQRLTMEEIFQLHHVDTPFVRRNYRDVLLKLEAEGRIQADPAKRTKGTFAKHVLVTFSP